MPTQIGSPCPSAPVFCSIAGHLARRMADEVRPVLAERFELGRRKEAVVGQHDEQRLDRVALALDVAVAVGSIERLRRDAQHAVVQHVEDVDAREAAAGVAGAGVLDGVQDVPPVRDRLAAQAGGPTSLVGSSRSFLQSRSGGGRGRCNVLRFPAIYNQKKNYSQVIDFRLLLLYLRPRGISKAACGARRAHGKAFHDATRTDSGARRRSRRQGATEWSRVCRHETLGDPSAPGNPACPDARLAARGR